MAAEIIDSLRADRIERAVLKTITAADKVFRGPNLFNDDPLNDLLRQGANNLFDAHNSRIAEMRAAFPGTAIAHVMKQAIDPTFRRAVEFERKVTDGAVFVEMESLLESLREHFKDHTIRAQDGEMISFGDHVYNLARANFREALESLIGVDVDLGEMPAPEIWPAILDRLERRKSGQAIPTTWQERIASAPGSGARSIAERIGHSGKLGGSER